jgi:hypothetical protein
MNSPSGHKQFSKLINDIQKIRTVQQLFNVEGICDNNFGQGDTPTPKRKPRIWYYRHEFLRTAPDQVIALAAPLLWRN